jgi:hypothetical protein
MNLHGFLVASLDLLALLESIERRHGAIETDFAALEALSSGDAMRSMLVLRLIAEHRAAEADLNRAAELISLF